MKVERAEILDFVTYGEQRAEIQATALAAKRLRRVVVADCLTFLFENAVTMRYQILEMIRTERIVREKDIQHEIDTYNELIGQDGELGVTLLIGIESPAERDEKLRRWVDMLPHVYVRLADGTRVRARWDERQISRERLSSVQYLKFAVGGRAPVACGVDFAGELVGETALSDEQQAALAGDF
ncbi:MAG: DUF3501 family protein [Myxococcales bacterium]|nr:DUF3501 family protein [Myxococcales bacterium]